MGEAAQSSVNYITNESGKKISVILPIKDYLQMVEDLHDLAVIAERKEEGTISLADLKKQLSII
jgi:hypothetical protein